MDTGEAMAMARGLMEEHGLTDWVVEYDEAKTRAGLCRFADRVISLSGPLTLLYDAAEVRETVLHEVAHALAGPRAKHGPRWRRVALEIGCSGRRCVDGAAPRIDGTWEGVCPRGHRTTRHRRPSRVVSCGQCSRRFDLAHLLTWTHRGEDAVPHPNYLAELAALTSGLPAPSTLRVGTAVEVVAPGMWAGCVGTVVRRGRTRYRVRLEGGGRVLELPFAAVAPVVEEEHLLDARSWWTAGVDDRDERGELDELDELDWEDRLEWEEVESA